MVKARASRFSAREVVCDDQVGQVGFLKSAPAASCKARAQKRLDMCPQERSWISRNKLNVNSCQIKFKVEVVTNATFNIGLNLFTGRGIYSRQSHIRLPVTGNWPATLYGHFPNT